MNNFPNSKTGTLEIGLDTYTDTTFSNFIGTKYVTLTASVPVDDTTKPSISMSTSINNGSLSSTFDGIAIQGKTRIDVTLSGEAKYNANITGCSAVIDGKSYTAKYNSTSGKYELTSNAIENYGAVPAVGYVKDSRGFTNSETNFANVTPYEKPLVIPLSTENAIMCYRSDGNGVRVSNSTSVWIKAKRKYYPVPTLGIQNNFCSLQYRFKATDGSWSGWSDLISKSNLDTNEYNALIPDEVFNIKKAYTIQIRAIDDIGESDTKTFDIPTQDVALHLGKGGKNVAVGTYCDYSEDYTFYSDWKAIFDKGFIDGTDTGWVAINNCVSYRVKCGYITIVGYSGGDITLTANDYKSVGTIPTQYKPATRIFFTWTAVGGGFDNQSAYVSTDGSINLYTVESDKSYWAFTITYPI